MPTPPLRLKLPLAEPAKPGGDLPPTLARPASRAGGPALPVVPVVPGVKVVTSWNLATTARGEAPPEQETLAEPALLALEAADGTTVFIRADKLAEDLARVRPELLQADGSIDLAGFRDEEAASRGLGDWVWRKVYALAVEDNIEDLAKGKLQDWLADKALEKLAGDKVLQCSTLGAKALMEAIELKLAGEPGLYQWNGGPLGPADRRLPGDGRLAAWGSEPALVFIHGTGSSTLGGFGDLRGSPDWEALLRAFGERIFGFEHRTFSQSPIDNALALAEALPAGANLCLVTHSRGGLVGDLLCLSGYTGNAEALVKDFRRVPRPDEVEAEADATNGKQLQALREQVAAEEQAKLRKLYGLLADKKFVIRRYVRVAAPAGGTALLSDNMEVFLSGLLELVRKLSAWGAGAAAGAISGGVAAKAAESVVSQTVGFLSRVVLEIARQRLQPQLVPGIEAMLPESPLGAFLARAGRRSETAMAVIAGDVEGGGMVKRIGVMFTDWMFFDRADNDLVVDTASMYAGLAREGAHALFDQGPEVNHFHYFRNPRTRGALRGWLVEADPARLPDWTPVASLLAEQAAVARSAAPPPPDNTRPVVIYLPGIMGSNLEVGRSEPERPGSGDRVWLDFLDLAAGGLKKIAFGRESVAPDDVVGLAYGKLANFLEKTHRVIRFPYDWRQSNLIQGDELAKVLGAALDTHPDQPVRILAHSMGGLVTRAMIARHPKLWEEMVKREGGRLVFMGTPHHGSHLMVENLLGKGSTMRMLARLDLAQGLQAVLDIVAGFHGALQLLPQPGFVDTAGPAVRDWLKAETWPALATGNDDFWFGKNLGGLPSQGDLDVADELWKTLDGGAPGGAAPIPHPERIAYVFGKAENTPCGVDIRTDAKGKTEVSLLGTVQGDGSVSWASGRLAWLPEDRYWLLPADHSGMVNTPDYFPAIDELLSTGTSSKLGRVPVSRGAAAEPLRRYNAAPPPGYPSEMELAAAVVGGRPRPTRPKAARAGMAVSMRAQDLRAIHIPVLCGHYQEDPIAGAERVIDQSLVNGALTQRVRLGVHAGPLGSASVVLMPRSREEVLRGTGKGALVVGLGEFGKLSAGDITDTVRAGVLRLLLHAADRQSEQRADPATARQPLALRLASVLIGYNSTTHISVDESVVAITLGVMEATQQFAERTPPERPAARIASLEFVEIYQDVALTGARAVANLPNLLARQSRALGVSLEPAKELFYGEGVRQRLSVTAGAYYWPRLMITDADRGDDACSPDCYRTRVVSAIPPDVVEDLLAKHGYGRLEAAGEGAPAAGSALAAAAAAPVAAQAPRYPERLRFLFLSERARAETVVQQRQPGLVEKLVAAETGNTAYNPEVGIGLTLFHLLVPLDFKAAARDAANLLLVVDGATANLPWEMLVADGEPLIRNTRVVRQLASSRFRPAPRATRLLSAYVVCNPSTQGYYTEFGGKRAPKAPEDDHLPHLPGAEEEGGLITAVLEGAGYKVINAPGGSQAADVVGKLYRQPYRILAIAAHGMFQVADRQGALKSGVVLSDGVFLTAAEVGQMEVVPELVFLSCCNLGRADVSAGYAPHRLAYSLARELIEMGVRCVVAAGWEVDDAAAKTFSTTFFQRFVGQGESFGNALFEARVACYEGHRDRNTWGAYQAYGDPAFTLGERGTSTDGEDGTLLAPVELVDWLNKLRLDACRNASTGAEKDRFDDTVARVRRRMRDLPPAWEARPDVQQALAALYAEFGESGFEAARAAYQAAIGADSTMGVVSLAAVEQLANLEARTAARLTDKEAALKRIDQAIDRLIHLHALAAGAPPGTTPNTERACLLGGAYKRKAELLVQAGKGWDAVEKVLIQARDAYTRGEAGPASPGFAPYASLNRLQLDAVLGTQLEDWEALLAQSQLAARQAFEKHFSFWDAVMPMDAEVTRCLLERGLAARVTELAEGYREATAAVAASNRQFDSVMRQWQLIGSFLKLAGRKAEAEALAQLAAQLGGGPAAAEGSAKPPRASAAGGRKGAAKKKGDKA